MELPDTEWEVGLNTQNLKIYRKLRAPGSFFMVKVFCDFPNIPKNIIYDAIADLNQRRKFDEILANLNILEEDPISGSVVF